LLDTVTITAQKKVNAEDVQDIPIAITAFGEQQIEALKLRNIADIGNRVPNAIIDEIGTFKGVAAFSVRGQASLSSIPTIDPTVGTFVDGVYYGINAGIVFDTFDLESIEVLRGPQGILFGRNVVGGAVLINTTRPSDKLVARAKASADSGLRGTGTNYTYSGLLSGPLTNSINGKIAIYYNDDKGWFRNKFDGATFGASTTTLVRGALSWDATQNTDFLLRMEYGKQDGEGVPAQSHLNAAGVPGMNFSPDTHDMSIDNRGTQSSEWSQILLESDTDVAFGNGTITNIIGWRKYDNANCLDVDGTPNDRFNSSCLQDPVGSLPIGINGGGQSQDQFSDELRYAGTFGTNFDLTSGLYYFQQDISYSENRSLIGGAVRQSGGGIQDHEVFGIFVNGTYQVSDAISLSAGTRYTQEKKSVKVASLGAPKPGATPAGFCVVAEGTCPYDFEDSDRWSNVDYKIGMKYLLADNIMLYANWATGFRSGGYNVRNSSPTDLPGPVDEESVDNFEAGLKTEPTDRSKLNLAAFYTDTKGLQRTVVTAGPFGPVQTTRNTADSEILGLEMDGQVLLTDHLILMGNIGILNAKYDKVLYDLTGDGIIDQTDIDLELPRTTDLTYSASIVHDIQLASAGSLTSRLSYTYRGDQYSSDNNDAYLPSQELLDFSVDWQPPNSKWEFSVYGKNILNDVVFTSDTQLPASLGSTYSTMKKGRTIGVQAKVSY